jgi:tetratricopeptide (TPR) repeat protein
MVLTQWLTFHSQALARVARYSEALHCVEEAVTAYRELAVDHPERFQPELVKALVNVSYLHGMLGRSQEGIAPAEEAAAICRNSPRAESSQFRRLLAVALASVSSRLAGANQSAEGITAAEEAIAICRDLEGSERDLAAILYTYSGCLKDLGRLPEAAEAARESAEIRRQLVPRAVRR